MLTEEREGLNDDDDETKTYGLGTSFDIEQTEAGVGVVVSHEGGEERSKISGGLADPEQFKQTVTKRP